MTTASTTRSHYVTQITYDFATDIYGSSLQDPQPTTLGGLNETASTVKKRTVIHLSLCDSLPGYGPISDMAFSLAKNGVNMLSTIRPVSCLNSSF